MTAKQQQQIEWGKLIQEALTVKGSLGNTYNRFYSYSYMNQIYLWLQGVNEPVATYKVWLENGRQVNKGQKAKTIVRPCFYKEVDEKTGVAEFKIKGFKPMACVFGYSQTAGDDLPEVKLPEWDIEMALKALDIAKIEYGLMDGNTQGYSTGREYAINPMAKFPIKTTMHELAHIVLGHTAGEGYDHRGIKEFQAEATAYLVCKELEVEAYDQSASRAYIQGWLQDQTPDDKAIKQVFKAVNDILTAGRPKKEYKK